jgi:hypothetical protein
MPTFTTEAEIDITYDEFWNDLSESEKNEFLKYLYEEKEIALPAGNEIFHKNLLDLEWDEVCLGLSQIRLNMTPDEQEIIEKIYRKYS